MFLSWSFPNGDIALMVTVTGAWNAFLKLALPVLALGLVAISGGGSSLLVPALIGLAILLLVVGLLAATLWRIKLAHAVGRWLGHASSRIRRMFRKPPVTTWAEGAV